MAAVAALPDRVALAGEHELALDVLEQLLVAGLMLLLDVGYHVEQRRYLGETLLAGLLGELGIHLGPLVVLACGRVPEVLLGLGHRSAVEQLEPYLGVLLLVVGGGLEELAYLDVAVFLRL